MRRHPGGSDNPVTNYGGITKFREETEAPVGWFSISNQKTPIDFFHAPVNSDTLVVFFHGAVRKNDTGPWFVGESILRDMPANRLSVSDPSLYLDDKLTLGWFIGSNQQNDVQGIIRRVIAHISELTAAKHLVFVGGSGGGFAALEMSRRFPESLALPINPQTSIRWYIPAAVAQYLRTAWGPSATFPDKLPKNAVHDVIPVYEKSQPNTVGYIQNSRDERHIREHMEPFMQVAGDRTNTWLLTGVWGDPSGSRHVPPPKDQLRDLLSTVVEYAGNWSAALRATGFDQYSHSRHAGG